MPSREEGECFRGHNVLDRRPQTDQGEGEQTAEGRYDQKHGTQTENEDAE